MKKVFFVPYTHLNEYVEINKSALLDAGYQVIPLNLKNAVCSLGKKRPIVVNWLEDRPYGSNFSPRVRFTTTIKCLFIAIFGALFCSRKIWIKHNFKPHNATGTFRYYKLITATLRRLNYRELSLEKYAGGGLFHPLYLPDDTLQKQEIELAGSEFEYLIFGAVKKYKGIHNILSIWPPGKKLSIFGKCNCQSYEKEILHIIEKRKLKVVWVNKYLTDEELNQELSKANFVVISHLDNTMISSGTFYHAVSFGCNIISSKSAFSTQKQNEHKFVHLISDNENQFDEFEKNYVNKELVKNEASKHYSRRCLSKRWQEILSNN
ncbi:hypothetical protein [Alteromonas gracilis]|uniref:hypothetical protein n=1 Tax=Alteromonas gracilis TaxID=1479524 RepID=UPI003734CC5A